MKRIVGYAFFVWLGAVLGLTPGMIFGWGDWPVFIGVPLMAVFMFLYGALTALRLATQEVQGKDE